VQFTFKTSSVTYKLTGTGVLLQQTRCEVQETCTALYGLLHAAIMLVISAITPFDF